MAFGEREAASGECEAPMGGAGVVVVFVFLFAGLVVWSVFYILFTAHYFLTTLTDSASGQDDVQYPTEAILSWAWKPAFCVWIFSAWAVPAALVTGPLMAASPQAFFIGFALVMLIVYPISLISALHGESWFFLIDPLVIWRMLRHYRALLYVYFITLLPVAASIGLVLAAVGHDFIFVLPASVSIATSVLFYARSWGRLTWLVLNYTRRRKRRKRRRIGGVLVSDVQVSDPWAQSVQEGLPPAMPGLIQAGASPRGENIVASEPPAPAAVEEEEEDEWSLNKKPYRLADSLPEALPGFEDKNPFSVVEYTEEQFHKAEEAEARIAAASYVPPIAHKRPTFKNALVLGVWQFMIYPRTIQVWIALVGLSAIELFLLIVVLKTMPPV